MLAPPPVPADDSQPIPVGMAATNARTTQYFVSTENDIFGSLFLIRHGWIDNFQSRIRSSAAASVRSIRSGVIVMNPFFQASTSVNSPDLGVPGAPVAQ
jgi:hypothetical protein